MLWDHRPGQNRFAGIVLQEYSPAQRKLVGARHNIFKGTSLGLTEAPHLYKRDGWYYLITAEGGTAWGHAVTMARSRALLGPYELHPDVHILSARHRPDVPCSAPATPIWWRPRAAKPTWSTCADGRSPTAGGARSAARPPFNR